jgi:hypothetical protein
MHPSPFDPQAYGPAFAALLAGDRRRPLDAGTPDRASREALEATSIESAFAHANVVDEEMAQCCLAGVWLLHDELDESHQISQDVDTPTGSFWHGVMHRREGDFSNSKYWFARIGRHEALPLIGASIRQAVAGVSDPREAQDTLLTRIAPAGGYNPSAMSDACQAALRPGADAGGRDFCERAQQAEWETLFDYCYRRAVGQ